uniref:Uncharacterized protein LOC111121445 isoform X2 n=1 Tax=Crassostrea virginica TaxID=6565 RepID=A0A8B8CRJ6_CRAVI|nr:uncharacterized protein LOC111121445 isoform X2 [Crassostrea virginica]
MKYLKIYVISIFFDRIERMGSSNNIPGVIITWKNESTNISPNVTDGRNVTTAGVEKNPDEIMIPIVLSVIAVLIAVLAYAFFCKKDHILKFCRLCTHRENTRDSGDERMNNEQFGNNIEMQINVSENMVPSERKQLNQEGEQLNGEREKENGEQLNPGELLNPEDNYLIQEKS